MRIIENPKVRFIIYPLLLLWAFTHIEGVVSARSVLNGFTVKDPLIPIEAIYHGGPPRDGIPALNKPKFVDAKRSKRLNPEDRVLGLYYQGEAKAYPISILDYHEVVNDRYGHDRVVISFCPLCGTGMAFNARVDGRNLTFGVSGLLYNSDVLMYDKQTESLWSQIDQQAVSGPMKGASLSMLPIEHTTWNDWKSRYPHTKVLSFDTGHSLDYKKTPYTGYNDSQLIYFPVTHEDKRYHPKEVVLGVEVDGVYKAYPFSALTKTDSPLEDRVNGKKISITFDAKSRTGRIHDENGKPYPVLSAFWFAWIAFHPETAVYQK
jgi:hypothetical protein